MKVVQPHRNRKNGSYNGRADKTKGKKGISVKRVDEYLRFAVFLAVIGMFYIWNGYKAEQQIREMEVVEKRSERPEIQISASKIYLECRNEILRNSNDGRFIGAQTPRTTSFKDCPEVGGSIADKHI